MFAVLDYKVKTGNALLQLYNCLYKCQVRLLQVTDTRMFFSVQAIGYTDVMERQISRVHMLQSACGSQYSGNLDGKKHAGLYSLISHAYHIELRIVD